MLSRFQSISHIKFFRITFLKDPWYCLKKIYYKIYNLTSTTFSQHPPFRHGFSLLSKLFVLFPIETLSTVWSKATQSLPALSLAGQIWFLMVTRSLITLLTPPRLELGCDGLIKSLWNKKDLYKAHLAFPIARVSSFTIKMSFMAFLFFV